MRIHHHVYNPTEFSLFKTDANAHAKVFTVECSESARCDVFARGECVARSMFNHCKYGIETKEEGPTKRARTFKSWIAAKKLEGKGIGQLSAPTKKMAKIGDYIWLPYHGIDAVLNGETTLFASSPMIPISEFTPDLVVRICCGYPRTILGNDVIRGYHQEEVPKFLTHLLEVFPEIAAEALSISEHVRKVLSRLTSVGRKAKLVTVVPNVGTFQRSNTGSDVWTWTGTEMVCANGGGPFIPFNATEVRIKPGINAVVTITDNAQVGPDTVFVD